MAEQPSPNPPATRQRIALITGTLMAPALQRPAEGLGRQFGVRLEVVVLKIQVAAPMTAEWADRKLKLPAGQFGRVVMPGHLRGDLELVRQAAGSLVKREQAS